MTASPSVTPHLDLEAIRADFPILSKMVKGHPLVYLDNAATTQKPRQVIDAIVRYYEEQNANVHRGVHHLSQIATSMYEDGRKKVARFINAASEREIVFVKGCTEGINLVANSFAAPRLREGDEILISAIEHHSNIVPWQLLCQRAGARLRIVPVNDLGELVLGELDSLLTERTKIASFVHVSNSLGTVNPVREMIARAKAAGVPVVIDGAQAVPHLPVDVQDLDCDFYIFSGHKMFGPTGIGVAYGKAEHLAAMGPWQGGGDMIESVRFEGSTWAQPPARFEAGTPNIEGVAGLSAAIDYILALGYEAIGAHEHDLLEYGTAELEKIEGLRIIGQAANKASVISFVLDDIHPHDLGTIVDEEGVAIRTGHHCTQPVMERFGVPATARASLAFYNTRAEIDALVRAIERAISIFR